MPPTHSLVVIVRELLWGSVLFKQHHLKASMRVGGRGVTHNGRVVLIRMNADVWSTAFQRHAGRGKGSTGLQKLDLD